jgi:hypothetical protein
MLRSTQKQYQLHAKSLAKKQKKEAAKNSEKKQVASEIIQETQEIIHDQEVEHKREESRHEETHENEAEMNSPPASPFPKLPKGFRFNEPKGYQVVSASHNFIREQFQRSNFCFFFLILKTSINSECYWTV